MVFHHGNITVCRMAAALPHSLFVYRILFTCFAQFLAFPSMGIPFSEKVVWAVLLVLLPLSGYLMYHMKKDSADGRLFIWKVSISLFSERPLKGFGYGRFGAVYNPYQEEYVEKYPLSVTEVQNIRSVNMPYNEFLEQCIGGGLVGGIFFMSIPAYFIALAYRRKRWVELAISGNILIMCSFNFVTQAIPVWFMYVF